ncbi:N-acetylneuraminate synthase family protein [Alphaproteobacteria bacterium]|nr:N-acetylneuraminate synthase family protein [Alphaproteobacteria bacterium]
MVAKIIAEMAWAHDGDLSKAKSILSSAKRAGADFFGIHVTSLVDYMVPFYGSGEGRVSEGKDTGDIFGYLSSINLSNDDWVDLRNYAKSIDIPLCVMPNDIQSMEFIEKKMKPESFVIAASAFCEYPLINRIASQNRQTFLRIGGASLGEVENVIEIFREIGNRKIVLLHGYQNYPTKIENSNISYMRTLKDMFGLPVGLADHIDGASPLSEILPILALPFGAEFIEKHITFDRSEKGEDFEAALDEEGFSRFVGNVRAAEIALGSPHWLGFTEGEEKYRKVSRKRVVAAAAIASGTVIEDKHLAFKRADEGFELQFVDQITGRKTNQDLSKDQAITDEVLL